MTRPQLLAALPWALLVVSALFNGGLLAVSRFGRVPHVTVVVGDARVEVGP